MGKRIHWSYDGTKAYYGVLNVGVGSRVELTETQMKQLDDVMTVASQLISCGTMGCFFSISHPLWRLIK